MEILKDDGTRQQFVPMTYSKPEGPTPRNERDNLVNQFTERLQQEWKPFYYDMFKKKHKMQSWTLKRVAIKLSYIKNIQDLYYLMSVCKSADSFTKMFNYLTKIQSR